MSQRTLRELFHGALKGMFFAERKILDALPKMANAAHSGELRAAFEKHEIESREHLIRLREVFRDLGETPHEKYCSGLVGANSGRTRRSHSHTRAPRRSMPH